MANEPTLGANRAAEISREVFWYRGYVAEPRQYFKMSDVIEDALRDGDVFRLREFDPGDDLLKRRKAGVVGFAGKYSFILPKGMMEGAREGQKEDNYALAHEWCHIILGHHESGAVVKNYQLFQTESGNVNRPPTQEELETNFAATLFQCGEAIFDKGVDPVRLGNRAFTNISEVRKVTRICQTSSFQEAVDKLIASRPRVVL